MNTQRAPWAKVFLLAGLCVGLAIVAVGCRHSAPSAAQALSERDLISGPSVTAVAPDGADIHWIAPAGMRGSCRLLEDAAGVVVTVSTSAITGREDVRYTATLSGLSPGRRYWYEVVSGRERAEGTFRTPPAAERGVNP